jgi:hypothetical protein
MSGRIQQAHRASRSVVTGATGGESGPASNRIQQP